MNDSVIAGALFDFTGWLTSCPKRIMLSSVDDAAPAVDALRDFAKMRGLSLDDARVQDWTHTPPQRKPWAGLTDKEAMQICVDCGCMSEDWLTLLDAIEAKLKEKNNG